MPSAVVQSRLETGLPRSSAAARGCQSLRGFEDFPFAIALSRRDRDYRAGRLTPSICAAARLAMRVSRAFQVRTSNRPDEKPSFVNKRTRDQIECVGSAGINGADRI